MAAAGEPLVLRIPRVERNPEPEFILLHVSPDGSRSLDLKLTGTDSSEVFAFTLKQSKTSTLKAKNSKIPLEEWEAILSAILLGEVPEDNAFMEGVEAISEVREEASMTITIQKRIEGITQRLGQIVLPCEEVEIDLYEWCCLSIKSKNTLKDKSSTLNVSLQEKDIQIKKLEDALSELTTLKNQNEDHLLEKFSLLLNEKKMKIRDQQRLLATATVDATKVEDMEVDREVSAGPSRPRKRKAKNTVESESDEGVEKMEVDEEPVEEEDSDKADERTASETESDSDTLPPPSIQKTKAKAKAVSPPKRKTRGASVKRIDSDTDDTPPPPLPKAKPVSPPRRKTRGSSVQPMETKHEDSDEELPPKRELPFSRKPPKKAAAPPPPPVAEGSETESDDEL